MLPIHGVIPTYEDRMAESEASQRLSVPGRGARSAAFKQASESEPPTDSRIRGSCRGADSGAGGRGPAYSPEPFTGLPFGLAENDQSSAYLTSFPRPRQRPSQSRSSSWSATFARSGEMA